MKWIYGFFIVLGFSRFECGTTEVDRCFSNCGHNAVVKDLSGLDGCGFALQLEDGTRLIPQRLQYIQPPDPKLDPGYFFDFKAEERVCFDFREVEVMDVCMAGNMVFLTCIKVCKDQGKN
jgi:hypothetical protein